MNLRRSLALTGVLAMLSTTTGLASSTAQAAARRSCSYQVHTYWYGGYGGWASAYFSYLSGCGPWQVKIRCTNNDGSKVWRYSTVAYDASSHKAGCYGDQTAGLAYWTGFWNDREHQMSP